MGAPALLLLGAETCARTLAVPQLLPARRAGVDVRAVGAESGSAHRQSTRLITGS